MMGATYLKVYRTAASLKKGPLAFYIGRTTEGWNGKIHAVHDASARPVRALLGSLFVAITVSSKKHFLQCQAGNFPMLGNLPPVTPLPHRR